MSKLAHSNDLTMTVIEIQNDPEAAADAIQRLEVRVAELEEENANWKATVLRKNQAFLDMCAVAQSKLDENIRLQEALEGLLGQMATCDLMRTEGQTGLPTTFERIHRARQALTPNPDTGSGVEMIENMSPEEWHKDRSDENPTVIDPDGLDEHPDTGTTTEPVKVQLFKKDLLLKIKQPDAAKFETVAGIRARCLDVDEATPKVTLSGSGVFKDEQSETLVRALFFDGVELSWQLVVPDFGLVEGTFQVTSLEYAGLSDTEYRFELGLEAVRNITITTEENG